MEVIFDNVSFLYQPNTSLAKEVFTNLNLKINKHKITALIGPSGSGKTTLVELINGLLIPTKGNLTVGNFHISSNLNHQDLNLLRLNVGLVFQFPEEQFFNLTVKDEIAFSLKYFKYKNDQIEKKLVDTLKMVGLDESCLEQSPFTLNSGEKRKVAIASVLILDPKLIILDEPLVGLDDLGKKKVMQLVRRLKYLYHKTIIIISHDLDLLYQFVDNVIILKTGQIIANGPKNEVFSNFDLLTKNNIYIPKIVSFTQKVLAKKGLNLGNYSEINDLIKMVYKNV